MGYGKKLRAAAVSYTHLDVYKRQDINNAVVENIAAFVTTGVTDDSWNSFVSMFDGMGVADYVQMYQDAIDTMDLE